MAKAKQIMGGMVLEATAALSDTDRKYIRRLMRPCGRTLGLSVRPGFKCRPPDLEARIAAHEAMHAAEAAKPEPLACWGPCGRTLPKKSQPQTWGWKVRRVVCSGALEIEAHCPECWNRWGFIDTKAG